ncbi:MAG: hypothetical protein GF317_12505 [Candidatus Lokiarchaeota archaeon]|nr:hypothetical protein [Candidatus Lokiarchaeota archaeon]MBD3200468.1 hypothetical protein [Candidatus Lokiarchaeota archaeon]
MKSYPEIIKGDSFDTSTTYRVDTEVTKMCWGCEKKNTTGYMVYDTSKMRSIFFCEDCYNKL